MESMGMTAMRLRAIGSQLIELRDEYDAAGQWEERDQVDEAEQAVRALFKLDEPGE